MTEGSPALIIVSSRKAPPIAPLDFMEEMVTNEELSYLAVNLLGLGPDQVERFCRMVGGLTGTFPSARWRQALPPSARALLPRLREMVQDEIGRASGISLLTPASEGFPPQLVELGESARGTAPLAVYLRGDRRALDIPTVALVGSRRASPYGLEVARGLAAELAARGVAVVSGLARGVDTASHLGALDGRGVTVAVLGSGLHRCYPRENRRLLEHIVESGLVLSEFPLQAPPLPRNFPRRNRIIAALADVVVVVEATESSGSRHTAEAALALGRPVMAVPGAITSPTSRGCNGLIRDGALPVLGLDDIVAALQSSRRWVGRQCRVATPAAPRSPARPASGIAALLSVETPRHVEELVEESGRPIPDILSELQLLVTEGVVRQLPGQYFQRVASLTE